MHGSVFAFVNKQLLVLLNEAHLPIAQHTLDGHAIH